MLQSFALIVGLLASLANSRPWHSAEDHGSWGSYSGIGGSFGGSLSGNLGGNFGLGIYHNGLNEGGPTGNGLNIFGTGSASISGHGFGNFGFFRGGYRFPKGYGFIPCGRRGSCNNRPSEVDGNRQPEQTPAVTPPPEQSSNPGSVAPTPRPSIEVPQEADTSGEPGSAPQPNTPNTQPNESQPGDAPSQPDTQHPIPVLPNDANSVESMDSPQPETPIAFFSAELDDNGREATSDERKFGGAGMLNPRFGESTSPEEERKPNFLEKLRRLFG